MKRLLTLSLLLLFSVDVFAEDEFCDVTEDNSRSAENEIERKCEKGDVIFLTLNLACKECGVGIGTALSTLFCDYNREIIIKQTGDSPMTLSCVMHDDERRSQKK